MPELGGWHHFIVLWYLTFLANVLSDSIGRPSYGMILSLNGRNFLEFLIYVLGSSSCCMTYGNTGCRVFKPGMQNKYIICNIENRNTGCLKTQVLMFLQKWPPHLILAKVTLFQKNFLVSSILPKTKEKNYYDTSGRLVFVVFWKNLKTPKRHFEINWPLQTYGQMTCYKHTALCMSSP